MQVKRVACITKILGVVTFQNISLFTDTGIHIRLITWQLLNKLQDSDISPGYEKQFYTAVRNFYTQGADYAVTNIQLKDPLLQNAKFVDFTNFVGKYICMYSTY